jgi:type IV pilus assembly protein PilN
MIKINLIGKGGAISAPAGGNPDIDMAMDATGGDIQKQGLIRLFIILLGPLALFLWQQQNLPGKAVVIAAKQRQLNELITKNANAKAAVEEIKKFKADQARLQEQINTIESLRKDRMREVRILDLVQREMPERMWLSKIEVKESKISVSGFAATDSELTQLMDVLTKSVFLSEVNLIHTNEKVIEGATLKEFAIGANLRKMDMNANGDGT